MAMAIGLVEIKVTFVLGWCHHRYCAAGTESRTPNPTDDRISTLEARKLAKNGPLSPASQLKCHRMFGSRALPAGPAAHISPALACLPRDG